jgi:hypothetical protein
MLVWFHDIMYIYAMGVLYNTLMVSHRHIITSRLFYN